MGKVKDKILNDAAKEIERIIDEANNKAFEIISSAKKKKEEIIKNAFLNREKIIKNEAEKKRIFEEVEENKLILKKKTNNIINLLI